MGLDVANQLDDLSNRAARVKRRFLFYIGAELSISEPELRRAGPNHPR